MANIEKKLIEWTQKGLISEQQKKDIETYESENEGHSWVYYGFLILGVSVIGLGLISIIAANWMYIHDSAKLFVDFLLLGTAAWVGNYYYSKNKRMHFEVALTGLGLLTLGSIGLISQIYHTGGKLYQALFLWSFLTMGLFLVSRRAAFPLLWFSLFTVALTNLIYQFSKVGFLTINDFGNYTVIAPTVGVLAVICAYFKALRPHAISGFLLAIISILSYFVLGEVIQGGFAKNVGHIKYLIPSYIATAVFVSLAWRLKSIDRRQKLALTLISLFYFIPIHLGGFELFYPAATILILSSFAVLFASLEYKKLFQFFLFLVGVRFLVIYFQVFGSLLETGIGLLLTGVVIIAFVYLWNKFRKPIYEWTQKKLQGN